MGEGMGEGRAEEQPASRPADIRKHRTTMKPAGGSEDTKLHGFFLHGISIRVNLTRHTRASELIRHDLHDIT